MVHSGNKEGNVWHPVCLDGHLALHCSIWCAVRKYSSHGLRRVLGPKGSDLLRQQCGSCHCIILPASVFFNVLNCFKNKAIKPKFLGMVVKDSTTLSLIMSQAPYPKTELYRSCCVHTGQSEVC